MRTIYDVKESMSKGFIIIERISIFVTLASLVVSMLVWREPWKALFALHPLLFAVVFGIIGNVNKKEVDGYVEKKKNLLQNGMVLWCYFECVERDDIFSVRYNKVRPYYVKCSYYDPSIGAKYSFKSVGLIDNPNLRLRPGSMLPVYVNPYNFGDYYVLVN